MITGTIIELEQHTGSPLYSCIRDYLQAVVRGEKKPGEWTHFEEFPGIKALPLTGSGSTEEVKEYHLRYADIHITLRGEDSIYIAEVPGEIMEAYHADGDYALEKAPTSFRLQLTEWQFALLETGERHCNILNPGSLKAVIKLTYPWQKPLPVS